MDTINLLYGDALKLIKAIPDKSVHLVLTDPPYNIGKAEWDRIDNYIDWCISWLKECERVLTDTGSLCLWHNDMRQIPALMEAVTHRTSFQFRQLCTWVKPNSRKIVWGHPSDKNTLRNWFNIAEYCLYYIKADGKTGKTGLDRINSNPECYKPLKDWYAAELVRLGLTKRDIAAQYTKVTGKKAHMLRHYFKDSQFEIPKRDVWELVYMPLGFGQSCEELRKSYEDLRKSYEDLCKSYEDLRPVHNLDDGHCNIWTSRQITGSESVGKNHICEKPVDILERIIRTSTRAGDVVFDPFMGSGSTGVAAINTGRRFTGIDNDKSSYMTARSRTGKALDGLAYTD